MQGVFSFGMNCKTLINLSKPKRSKSIFQPPPTLTPSPVCSFGLRQGSLGSRIGRAEEDAAMKAFIDSLSVTSGAVLIAVCSMVLVLPLCWLRSSIRWLGVLVVPFVLATCLYWSPVWLGDNSSEYSSWAVLFIGRWTLAGTVPSAVIVLIFGRQPKK